MKYKLICTDMDGTLLDPQHNISDENKEALKLAKEKGIIVAVTTGRLFTSAKHYFSFLGFEGPIIASNGTYIREEGKDEFLYKASFTFEESKEIYDLIKTTSLKPIFYTYDTAISEEAFPADHPYMISNKDMPLEDRVKFRIASDLNPLLKEYKDEIQKCIVIENKDTETLFKLKEKIKALNKYEVVSSGDNNFEVMKKGSSKGDAVKRLAEALGIKREEIICIGDNENDISMIKYAGLGVAMCNGVEDLKKLSDMITDSNLNSGVGKIINKIINSEG